MKPQIILNNLGFNEKEVNIYLTLLRIGESNLQAIANESGIPRTTLYIWIKRLIQKGAIEFYKRKGTIYYLAASPDKILNIAKNNIEFLKNNIKSFYDIVDKENIRPRIRFFERKEGIRFVLNEILEDKYPVYAITSIDDMRIIAKDYFEYFIKKRIEQNLSVKLITNKTEESEMLKLKDDSELRITRFVAKKYNFHTANYVFGNKVAIFSLRKTNPFAVLIEDKLIADTQRMYFESLWEHI